MPSMPHLCLLGDSIFDNATYVPGEPAVIDQVRAALPGWAATLLAVDGAVVADIDEQMRTLPPDATHLAVSVGGNDALRASGLLAERVASVDQALLLLDDARERFRAEYRAMLELVRRANVPTAICTVYDSVPTIGRGALCALALFNEVVLREACAARFDVVDLRSICTERTDYSAISPIEPSSRGGEKIARVLARFATSAPSDEGRFFVG